MRENKLKIVASICASIIGVAALVVSVLIAPYLPRLVAVTNIIVGISVFVFTFAIALEKDYDAGNYECKKCHKRFKPTFWAYFWAMHTPMKRRLKCPHCGEKSFCKRRID